MATFEEMVETIRTGRKSPISDVDFIVDTQCNFSELYIDPIVEEYVTKVEIKCCWSAKLDQYKQGEQNAVRMIKRTLYKEITDNVLSLRKAYYERDREKVEMLFRNIMEIIT